VIKRDPDNQHKLIVSLGLLLHGTLWKNFQAPTLGEAIRKADLAL
jgi:hypothetical protein